MAASKGGILMALFKNNCEALRADTISTDIRRKILRYSKLIVAGVAIFFFLLRQSFHRVACNHNEKMAWLLFKEVCHLTRDHGDLPPPPPP